jgi:hypothetical protein
VQKFSLAVAAFDLILPPSQAGLRSMKSASRPAAKRLQLRAPAICCYFLRIFENPQNDLLYLKPLAAILRSQN